MNKNDDEEYLINRTRPYEVDYLYKYREVSSIGLERIITHGELFLSDPTSFNDPFDCRPKISIHASEYKRKRYIKALAKERLPNATPKELSKEIKSYSKNKNLANPKLLNDMFSKFIKSCGIYCLTEVPDDILMWSHYSDSHKGICLQFNPNKELSILWENYKITYQELYPNVNLMQLHKFDQFINLFAIKSEHWEYEQERRIIKSHYDGGSKIYTFDTELLTGIILGAKISSNDEKTILDWVSKKKTPTKIYKAKIDGDAYRLNIKGINC